MSFWKHYSNRKDWRKPYRTCHDTRRCERYRDNRLANAKRREQAAMEKEGERWIRS